MGRRGAERAHGATPEATLIISIDPDRKRPIYIQIMDEVRRGRVLGTLAPGDPLPSVRQLAAELGVNPNTVQQAYRELEREGLVEVRRGQGTFVADLPVDEAERSALLQVVAERALLDAQRHGASPGELIDAIRAFANRSERESA